MFGRSTASFDRLLEKATSKLLLDPDWESTLQICDNIRQGDVQPSYALQMIKKKIENDNPHIAKFALMVLESIVKNCGSIVHVDVATRDFMDFMKDQAKKRPDPVKAKIVELIQVWSHAFRNEPSYKVVPDTYNDMKREGFTFPTLKESDAMFLSEKAPDWRDGECCHRCRVQFGLVQRKHHCRACGQIFCNKCSAKSSIVPKFGIEKEVRVCDSCFDKLNKTSGEKKTDDDLPAEYLASSLSKQSQGPPERSEQEIQEEEELQLALALSQSEQEAKDKERNRSHKVGSSVSSSGTSDNSLATSSIYSQPSKLPAAVIDTTDMDPELARYLNRNYWQQKSVELKSTVTPPSAPAIATAAATTNCKQSSQAATGHMPNEKQSNGEVVLTVSDEDREQFLEALRSSMEIFVNRMRSNSQRGRSIATDSSVQTLFMTLTAMHPQLMQYIQQQEDYRAHYETLQDKLAQLKDARDALTVLRDEHREKRRREQEEMERLRQIQMAQKLEVLRKKKQEYLEYQRQMALQRLQEQEMEMRRRLEQQKHEQQMRAMQYTYPQMYASAAPYMPIGDGTVHCQSYYGPAPSASPAYVMTAGYHDDGTGGGGGVGGVVPGSMMSAPAAYQQAPLQPPPSTFIAGGHSSVPTAAGIEYQGGGGGVYNMHGMAAALTPHHQQHVYSAPTVQPAPAPVTASLHQPPPGTNESSLISFD